MLAMLCVARVPRPAACVNSMLDEHRRVTGAAGPVNDTDACRVTAACAAGASVAGVDVSYHQGTVDWPVVRARGVEFAFTRVSDGVAFEDTKLARN